MALNERQCSVSEIVLMHESKNQSNHAMDRPDRSLSVDSANGSASPNRSKYATQSTHSSSVDSPRLSSETGLSSAETSSTVSSASNQTKQDNDEIAIRTYAGLSATTQERIRRFEQETRLMLQNRQRREAAEKREEERRRIEMEWQLAKHEMENDDLLDSIVDTTVSPSLLSERLSGLNDRLADKSLMDLSERPVRDSRSRSTTRSPLSIAVQQQPTIHQKTQATNQLSNVLGEKMNNGVIKKFKTDKDVSWPLIGSLIFLSLIRLSVPLILPLFNPLLIVV